jgi:hypothetical protein
MGHIRPFGRDDIPQVARLHQTVFKPQGRTSAAALDSYPPYLSQVFLDNPFCDPCLPSLVYEDDGGRIAGFLGSAPRRMVLHGRRIRAAVSSQFVVDPAGPVGLVAVRLAKAFLEGPQDLSIADDATDASRRIWEGLGGATAPLLSLHWTRPLRPAGLAISLIRHRRGLAPLAALASPVAAVIDALATRLPRSYFYQSPSKVSAADLHVPTVPSSLTDFLDAGTLHVEYDERTFAWLVERAAQARPGGRLQKTILRDGHRILGWCVWHLDREGQANVLQLKALSAAVHDVLDHLFWDTGRQGAIAVTGRLEPRFVQALSDKYCLFHRRGPWMLIHARNPEFLQPFWAGSVSFSRLDGEWALAF